MTGVEIGNVLEALEEGDIRFMSQQRTYYVIYLYAAVRDNCDDGGQRARSLAF